MNKILAAIDGSTYDASVCDHATWLAKRLDNEIELIHVIGRRSQANDDHDLSGSIGVDAREHLLDELAELDSRRAKLAMEHGRALLQDAKKSIEEAGISKVSVMLRHDELPETINELESYANAIVLGKRGKSANFATMHIGSNLERVARSTNTPLLVASRTFNPIKKALIAYDGGPSCNRAIKMLANNTNFNDVEVDLMYVGKPAPVRDKLIQGATEQLRESGYTVKSHIQDGTVEKVLADHVATHNIDLLFMGAYGHSRIRNLLIGSTTTDMLRTCLVPVVLFR